ncbi:MAG TPA: CoA-binding protein [Bacteroidales bacterium]|nr:CoA-binding protein [Bacteroidales bacterium]
MTSLKQINQFIDSQPIAMVGVSQNPNKFGHTAFKELKAKGMNLIPVNPEVDHILGEKTYRNISVLPSDVKGIIVTTKKTKTAAIVREAIDRGIKNIWIQQMSDSPEAIDQLKASDVNYIVGECILMHYKAHGIHKFHGKLKKFFGKFPK